MKTAKRMSALAVQRSGPGMHHDGDGLYLRVSKSGAKSWVLRFMIKGKNHEMGLGSLKYVNLAEARLAAAEARSLCYRGENPIEASRPTRLPTKTPEYWAWSDMIQRCTNPSNPHFKDYGGRKIAVCKAWFKYAAFWAAMGAKPSSSHSLDRKDNNGNYEPSNCRWATKKEQAANRRPRRNRRLTDNEILAIRSSTDTLRGIGAAYDISKSMVWDIRNLIKYADVRRADE